MPAGGCNRRSLGVISIQAVVTAILQEPYMTAGAGNRSPREAMASLRHASFVGNQVGATPQQRHVAGNLALGQICIHLGQALVIHSVLIRSGDTLKRMCL